MTFIPAHSAIVLFTDDPFTITGSASAPTLTNAPTAPQILGYTNLPQASRGLGNSKGFALGVQGAAYNKRGVVSPQIDLEIRPASLEVLQKLFPKSDGTLQQIALYVLVKGHYVDIYRGCKVSSVDFKFDGKGGSELTISASFMALAYEHHESVTTNDVTVDYVTTAVTPSAIRALGTPLFWHDVRDFTLIPHGTTTPSSYRQALMSLSAKVDYGLERKNQRPDYGDDNSLSRTSYALLEHHQTVTGEVALHERLPESLFTGALHSQDWGNITISCSNLPATAGGTPDKSFALSLSGVFPSDETQSSAEASAEIDHTIPITADQLTLIWPNPPANEGGEEGEEGGA